MCLIAFAWQQHPHYPLVVAANRDEFFARPALPADWWEDAPHILAGRDVQAGGTWLGVNRAGHFAALTNFRAPKDQRPGAPSRGELVRHCLENGDEALGTLRTLAQRSHLYPGFNLLSCDGRQMAILESRNRSARALPPGVYGLSNHLLNTPWPKLQRARARLAAALAHLPHTDTLLTLLLDDQRAPDDELPSTGISLEWERLLSSVFIRGEGYGTRCSSIVLARADGHMQFYEWSWSPDGELQNFVEYAFGSQPTSQAR